MHFEDILFALMVVTGVVTFGYFLYRKQSSKSKKAQHLPARVTWFAELCRSVFPIFLIVFLIRSFLFEPFRIPSGSMRPTLLEGDFILVNKFAYGVRLPFLRVDLIPVGKPKVGDIVIFRHKDGKDMVKRVIGVPGDHVRYIDKQLYINDLIVPTTYVNTTKDYGMPATKLLERLDSTPHPIYVYPHRAFTNYAYSNVIVPADSYFVMGDNRDNSIDGRFWGFVQDRDLLGKAVATLISWDSDGSDLLPIRWDRVVKSVYRTNQ